MHLKVQLNSDAYCYYLAKSKDGIKLFQLECRLYNQLWPNAEIGICEFYKNVTCPYANVSVTKHLPHCAHIRFMNCKRKRKKFDSVLYQKPLYRQKIKKPSQ